MKNDLVSKPGRIKPQRRGITIFDREGATVRSRTGRKKQMKERLLVFIFGFLFLSGIILAGSDGTFFPWLNVSGLLLTAGAVFISHRLDASSF